MVPLTVYLSNPPQRLPSWFLWAITAGPHKRYFQRCEPPIPRNQRVVRGCIWHFGSGRWIPFLFAENAIAVFLSFPTCGHTTQIPKFTGRSAPDSRQRRHQRTLSRGRSCHGPYWIWQFCSTPNIFLCQTAIDTAFRDGGWSRPTPS